MGDQSGIVDIVYDILLIPTQDKESRTSKTYKDEVFYRLYNKLGHSKFVDLLKNANYFELAKLLAEDGNQVFIFGLDKFNFKDSDQATSDFKEAIALLNNPKDSLDYHTLGWAYYCSNDYKQAIDSLRK